MEQNIKLDKDLEKTAGDADQLESDSARLTREIERMKCDIVREKFNVSNIAQLMNGHKADLAENLVSLSSI